MNRMKKSLPLMLLAMVLLLSACGQKPVFGMSTNEDNSISITADRGPKDSMGLGYLTAGKNEQVVIDATGMDKGGKLSLRFMVGVLGSDDFPEEPDYKRLSAVGTAQATASISGASWIKRGRCPSGSFRGFILFLLTTAVSSPGGITHRKAPRAVERASAV